jgi:predicted ATPase
MSDGTDVQVGEADSSHLKSILNFKSAGIYGRDEQIVELRQLFDEVCTTSCTQIAMVVGASGTGKSSVVQAALQDYSNSYGAVFAEAKFDQLGKSPRPFSAFVDVLTQLCQDLSDEQKVSMQSVIAEDTSIAYAIPTLIDFVSTDTLLGATEASSFAEEKFLSGYRNVIRAICTEDHPSVIFLDDLQWADDTSLELLRHIAKDISSQYLLLVGAYRDNEVNSGDPLALKLEEINAQRSIRNIKVDNLDVETMSKWLGSLLGRNSDSTRQLAEVTVKKTMGNVFYSVQFLESSQERGYLRFDAGNARWIWRIGDVLSRSDDSDNVVDLVIDRVRMLDRSLRFYLKAAACIGARFPPTLVCSIVRNTYKVEVDTATSDALMTLGLIESDVDGWEKFAHDRIQQAALILLDTSDVESRTSLHWKIGMALVDALDTPLPGVSAEWTIFAAADQLNRGAACIFDMEDSVLLARLNLQAGNLAKQKCAFSVAAAYAEAGFDCLSGPNRWTHHYSTSINLASLCADMAYCSGNMEQCSTMADLVIANGRSVDDKLLAFFARVQMLVTSGNIDEGVMECLNVLDLLGYKLSRQPRNRHVLSALLKAAIKLRGRSDTNLLSMPAMSDALQVAAMIFLSLASSYAGISSNKVLENVFVTATCKLVTVTVANGVCPHTPVAYGSYAALLQLLGFPKTGCRYSKLALRFLEETEHKQHTSWTTNLAYNWGGLNRIISPYLTLEPFLYAYRKGMHYGFVDDAVLSAGLHCESRIMAGQPLKPLVRDLRRYLGIMKDYRQETMYQAFVPHLQFCLNMQLGSRIPGVLSGEVMDEEELMQQIKASNNSMALGNLFSVRIEMSYYDGEFENAALLGDEFRKLCKEELSVEIAASCLVATFYEGLACFALIRQNQKESRERREVRRYRSRGRQCLKFFLQSQQAHSSWIWLLQAEQLSLDRNATYQSIQKLYVNAADSASRLDMSNIQALACERLADFIISRGGDGEAYMLDSCCHYSTWGATSKVLSLQRKYSVDSRLLELDFSTERSSQAPSGLPGYSMDWSPSLLSNRQ